MHNIVIIIIWTAGAGLCIPAGGLLARIERIRPDWLEQEFRHFIIAFGGGVLVSAVALVLIPEGMTLLRDTPATSLYVLIGGLIFFLIERSLGRRSRETPQFSAMLLDYLPESIALGGMFTIDSSAAPLLAVLIGLQNLPEGFNAYRELITVKGHQPDRILRQMFMLVPLGPILGVFGWLFLSEYGYLVGVVMLLAAGGILYLIFQDIAPQSRMSRHWGPPLGAVCGFSLALLGKILVNII